MNKLLLSYVIFQLGLVIWDGLVYYRLSNSYFPVVLIPQHFNSSLLDGTMYIHFSGRPQFYTYFIYMDMKICTYLYKYVYIIITQILIEYLLYKLVEL